MQALLSAMIVCTGTLVITTSNTDVYVCSPKCALSEIHAANQQHIVLQYLPPLLLIICIGCLVNLEDSIHHTVLPTVFNNMHHMQHAACYVDSVHPLGEVQPSHTDMPLCHEPRGTQSALIFTLICFLRQEA